MPVTALLFTLLFAPAREPQDRSPTDEPVSIELESTDPLSPGRGSAYRQTYTPDFDGTLYVWVSGQQRVLVRVERPRRALRL